MVGLRSTLAALLLASALAACQTPAEKQPVGNVVFAGLGGTNWRLVEIQSMDDSQGTTRPDDPAKYTIAFGNNGSASARFDCNRGLGSWKNDIANASGGSLEFGLMAVTRAYCPPPSLGEKLELHLRYVRSFMIREGRLYMSLMADGGILVWEPTHDGN